MGFDFFSKAKNVEQAKRHLNTVFLCVLDEMNCSIVGFSNQLFEIRKLGDYKTTFNFFLSLEKFQIFYPFLFYLKERYEISDVIFEKIIGVQELLENYKTPGGYSQEQDFILMFHLIFLFFLNQNSDKPLIEPVFRIAKALNYSADQMEFIYKCIGKNINGIDTYEELPNLEEIVKREFVNHFSNLPELSHG